MGLFDSVFKNKGDETPAASATGPFKVSVQFSPLRLAAMKDNKVNMIIKVTNTSAENQLVSLDAMLPANKLVGFDATCIHRHIEKKMGEVRAGETKELVVPIFANNQTQGGNYDIHIKAYAHYLDYKRVLGGVQKKITLRVV